MPAIDVLDKFYHSGPWRKVRKIIVKHYLGLCQECGATGSEVHHKIPLTVDNVNDPMISLNPDNLTLLCKSCHDAIRSEGIVVRIMVIQMRIMACFISTITMLIMLTLTTARVIYYQYKITRI